MKKGFTLIELMIVILIIGIITSLGLPRILRGSLTQTEQFISRLNSLVQDGVQLALSTHEPQKITFGLTAKQVELQSIPDNKVRRTLAIPAVVDIEDVTINGKPQFTSGGQRQAFYFLINPDGVSQEVVMLVHDVAMEKRSQHSGRYEFYLNPFTGVFRLR